MATYASARMTYTLLAWQAATLHAELRACKEVLEAQQRSLRQLQQHQAELLRNARPTLRNK